jgi:hypothetical protein
MSGFFYCKAGILANYAHFSTNYADHRLQALLFAILIVDADRSVQPVKQ